MTEGLLYFCSAHSPDRGVFYRKQLTLKHPSSACEVKVISQLFIPLCTCFSLPFAVLVDPSISVSAAVTGWSPQRFGESNHYRTMADAVQPGTQSHNRHAAGTKSGG